MRRRHRQTMAVSMPHGKVYRPAKFRELTGMRRAPKYDPDHTLVSALEYARHKTGLGYRIWGEFIRDFPKVREDYTGDDQKRYDARQHEIYKRLKHRDDKYMAQFATYMSDTCETAVRAYRKRRAYNPQRAAPFMHQPRTAAGGRLMCHIWPQLLVQTV